MDEYIEREAAIESIMSEPPDAHYPQWYADKILSIPVADVATVRHGQWIWHSEERGYLCSECGSGCLLNYESDWHKSDWCPHCGTKMECGSDG